MNLDCGLSICGLHHLKLFVPSEFDSVHCAVLLKGGAEKGACQWSQSTHTLTHTHTYTRTHAHTHSEEDLHHGAFEQVVLLKCETEDRGGVR